MATALKTPPAGMTGAVRSLQWTIQDLNSSVEHLGQSHDHLRRAQNMMAWTTAIFGALLLSGLVWIANDIFHLKDQMTDNNRRFDGLDAQMSALGTRLDDLNLTIEQVGAEILAGRNTPLQDAAGPEVSVLSTPSGAAGVQAVPADPAALDATAQTQQQAALAQQAPVAAAPATAAVAPAPAAPATGAPAVAAADPLLSDVVVPSPPAPRAGLTPEELAQQSPVVTAAAPASEPAPAAATPAAEPAAAASSEVAAAAALAAAAAVPAASGGQLSDDQLLSYNDDQIDPADELLLLDENGNPQ